MLKKLFLSFLVFLVALYLHAQPFADEIAAFKKEDSIKLSPKNSILFVGSSSFRKWTDVQEYFPGYSIINRGFGGSSLTDLIRYENDIIFPYLPKQIVIYCGENDLAASDSITAEIVFERFKMLFRDIRNRFPDIPIAFISIKPSPSRQQLMSKMKKTNSLIKNFLEQKEKTAFINIYSKMLNRNSTPKDDIFIEDKLHMNAKGYSIWQKVIKPYLLKN